MALARSRKPPHPKKHSTYAGFDFGLFFKLAKTFLLLCSIVSFLFGLLYVYPYLIAACTDTLPPLWFALHSWLTPPVLFVLTNLVVGGVAVTSGFVQRAKKSNAPVIEEDGRDEGKEEEDEVDTKPTSAYSVKNRSDHKSSASSRSEGKPFTRLVRSKSEQLPALKKGALDRLCLKKSGTLESTTSASAHKKTSCAPPNVIVVDNPSEEEVIPGGEEVDKQAEAFIGKFYQQMKLQRLESFLRHKGRIDKSHR